MGKLWLKTEHILGTMLRGLLLTLESLKLLRNEA